MLRYSCVQFQGGQDAEVASAQMADLKSPSMSVHVKFSPQCLRYLNLFQLHIVKLLLQVICVAGSCSACNVVGWARQKSVASVYNVVRWARQNHPPVAYNIQRTHEIALRTLYCLCYGPALSTVHIIHIARYNLTRLLTAPSEDWQNIASCSTL